MSARVITRLYSCFSRRFIITVTAFTVLFTAWYIAQLYFYLFMLSLSLKIINLYNNYYAVLCCKAPRTASWKGRSINKIIIIIIIIIIHRASWDHSQ